MKKSSGKQFSGINVNEDIQILRDSTDNAGFNTATYEDNHTDVESERWENMEYIQAVEEQIETMVGIHNVESEEPPRKKQKRGKSNSNSNNSRRRSSRNKNQYQVNNRLGMF